MGKKKKNKSWTLKVIYIICVIIVFIVGLYYEKGYKDINSFISDITNNILKVATTMEDNTSNTLSNDNRSNIVSKKVNGKLQMHLIDVGQRR